MQTGQNIRMRFFNTAGPVDCKRHYCLPPLQRLDLKRVLRLIEQQKYFVLHAPRQTGKTSALLALMAHLNQSGDFRCLYVNVEVGQAARENVEAAKRAILSQLSTWAEFALTDTFIENHWQDILLSSGSLAALGAVLTRWCEHDARPVVLLIDEIDALIGDSLISVLRQLRAGYARRPQHFPQSIILCGVRDVRDYRIHSSSEKEIITGGSAFNIRAESLRLGDFSRDEVEKLLKQHTKESGQDITDEAIARVWTLTEGQPWLVNALAYETCFRIPQGEDRSRKITDELIEQAKENLILRRETHLDQLADKLREDRVRRIVEPLLSGKGQLEDIPLDDLEYVRDLGMIKINGQARIANPIYREVIPRQLTSATEAMISQDPQAYIQPDGRLDLTKLLAAFADFFRENSEHWIERFQYKEAGPQLLMQAFLQRIVNSGGRIEREYGLGRLRTDLLVLWPQPSGVQKAVIELKLLRRSLEQTIAEGLQQTWGYMDRCGADEGHLVIFDRREKRSWEERLFQRQESFQGKPIAVWGM